MTTQDVSTAATGPMKDRLVEAALDGLRDLDPTALLHAIGAREIARRAGSASPAIINHHYGSLAGLAEAVVARVFDTAHLNPPRINELINHVKDSTLPLPVAFAMHEAEFTRMTTDPEFKLRMGLWALGGDQANNRYGPYLRELDDLLIEAGEALFDSWGRELRPPIDMRLYMALKIALINGTTVRQLADPDDRRMHLFQRATVALDLVLLRVRGDRHDIDGRLSEMNYYPLAKTTSRTSNRSRTTDARILKAASELFALQGFDATTTDQISTHSDVGITTLKRYYPTKQELAVALFHHHATNDPTLTTNDDTTQSPTGLQDHLSALTHFARARPAITTAYITHLADPNTSHHNDPLIKQAATYISQHTAPDRHGRAETLVLHTIRRALTHRTEPAETVATHTLDLINH